MVYLSTGVRRFRQRVNCLFLLFGNESDLLVVRKQNSKNKVKIWKMFLSGGPGSASPTEVCVCVIQGAERYKFPNSNPFVEEDMDQSEVASVAYR